MTQQDPSTPTSPARTSRGQFARTAVAAAATAAAMVVVAPAIAGAAPIEAAVAGPAAPTLSTAVDGNDLTITLTDPNTSQRLTTCTAALVSVDKAIPLLPALATGTLPPLSEIDPGVFAWGPSLTTTNFVTRERTYQLTDVPTGIYLTLGICTNLGGVAADYAPTFIGPTVQVGSAAIQLGSTVIETREPSPRSSNCSVSTPAAWAAPTVSAAPPAASAAPTVSAAPPAASAAPAAPTVRAVPRAASAVPPAASAAARVRSARPAAWVRPAASGALDAPGSLGS
ncbi:hypothetical protein P9209_05760 [Prescottella defluvii]|nr:hypothetical protein P9209_05760 [Prescottella defluvii]